MEPHHRNSMHGMSLERGGCSGTARPVRRAGQGNEPGASSTPALTRPNSELKHRGVQDILIVCVDGLTGFLEVIEAIFPKATVQTCICI
jgi:hypothetical protein